MQYTVTWYISTTLEKKPHRQSPNQNRWGPKYRAAPAETIHPNKPNSRETRDPSTATYHASRLYYYYYCYYQTTITPPPQHCLNNQSFPPSRTKPRTLKKYPLFNHLPIPILQKEKKAKLPGPSLIPSPLLLPLFTSTVLCISAFYFYFYFCLALAITSKIFPPTFRPSSVDSVRFNQFHQPTARVRFCDGRLSSSLAIKPSSLGGPSQVKQKV